MERQRWQERTEEVIPELYSLPQNEYGISKLASLDEGMHTIQGLREMGPLMIKPLTTLFSKREDNQFSLNFGVSIKQLLFKISSVCRSHEAFTLFVEAWVDYPGNHELRVYLQMCMTVSLTIASTGPLAKNKTQFLVQLSSLILNSYFKPGKAEEGINSVLKLALAEGITRLITECSNALVFQVEHDRNEMAVVCRLDILTVLLLRVNRYLACHTQQFPGQERISLSILHKEFFHGAANYSEIYRIILGRAKSLKSRQVEHAPYMDLLESDVAWFVSSSVAENSLPVILSPDLRLEMLLRAASNHAAAGEAIQAFRDFKRAGQEAKKFPEYFQPLGDLIELATSSPPESPGAPGLSMCQRSEIYTTFVNLMKLADIDRVMEVTWKFVVGSRNDSAVGIFIKVAKDRWADSAEISPRCFNFLEQISSNIFASDSPVSDGIDSLTSLLNFARFIIIKHKPDSLRNLLKKNLEIASRKIDAELAAVSGDQHTRVLTVGALLGRVKELLDF